MKHLALITGCILLALISGACASSGLLSKPKLGLEKTADVDETVYTSSDLHKLILNNLGLLSDQKLTQANEKIINNYGEPVLTQKILLNYLILIDTDAELFTAQNFAENKKPVKVDACSCCLVGKLYDNAKEDSVVSAFEEAHQKNAHVANHIYTSIPAVSDLYSQYSFSFEYDTYGNAIIVENRSGRKFPINKNVSKCINDVTKPEISFDLPNGIISTNNGSITFKTEDRASLKNFAEDVCFLISMPRFISKDTTPALFTFILHALRTVENTIQAQDRAVLHKIVELAYKQFKNVLAKKLGEQHVTGQIVLTNSSKTLEASAQKKLSEGAPRQVRVLAEETQAAAAVAAISSAQVVFRVFGVAFVIVLAIILASLAGIQVEKDTLVYSKFLTVDRK